MQSTRSSSRGNGVKTAWPRLCKSMVLGHALLPLPCGGSAVIVSLSFSPVSPREPVPVQPLSTLPTGLAMRADCSGDDWTMCVLSDGPPLWSAALRPRCPPGSRQQGRLGMAEALGFGRVASSPASACPPPQALCQIVSPFWAQVHVPVQQPGLKPRLGDPRPALCSSPPPTTLLFWFEGLPFLPSLWDVMRTEGGNRGGHSNTSGSLPLLLLLLLWTWLWASSCRKPSLLWPQHSRAAWTVSSSLPLNEENISLWACKWALGPFLGWDPVPTAWRQVRMGL